MYDKARSLTQKGIGALLLWQSLTQQHGDHTYLVVIRNVRELRSDGGAILSLAPLTLNRGGITAADVKSVSEFPRLTNGIQPDDSVPPWFRESAAAQARYQNVPYNPDFTGSGPVLRLMYEQQTGTKVDGVIGIDQVALKEILSVTGPVAVQGLTHRWGISMQLSGEKSVRTITDNGPPTLVHPVNNRLSLTRLVKIPAGAQVKFAYKYKLPRQRPGHSLELIFQPQATAAPDTLNVKVTAPTGCKWDSGGRIKTLNYSLNSVIRERLH